MSRTKKQSPSQAHELDVDFWQKYGLAEDSSSRDKLVALAMAEISRRGILDVNARSLCDLLGVDYSLITYHFGSFDGLLAEVFVAVHDIWIQSINNAVSEEYPNAEDRLRAVLRAQVQRAEVFGMVVGVAHLPNVSENVAVILEKKFPGRLSAAIAYSIGVTTLLISDLRTGDTSELSIDVFNEPESLLKADLEQELLLASQVQWAMVGPTLWQTSSAGGSEDLIKIEGSPDPGLILESYIENLIAFIKQQVGL